MATAVVDATGLKRASEINPAGLLARFQRVRAATERLCEPLCVEDFVIQTMPDVSPTKWHLAHTSWFFETFVLSAHAADYRPFDEAFARLFNSYYNAVGPQVPRPCRGHLSRPTVEQTFAYRAHVDEHVARLMGSASPETAAQLEPLIELGLQHEQQHQELILTDIKHVLSVNPSRPAYRKDAVRTASATATPIAWQPFPAAQRWIGHAGPGFAYDNEMPRHPVIVDAFKLASRLVTNGEYLAFMADGGYERPELWLSDGWSARIENDWTAPLYWTRCENRWWHFTLGGLREVDPSEPVCHVSFYEADAYARWADAWLPAEAAWEIAAADLPVAGVFADDGVYHPRPAAAGEGRPLQQMFGDVWEWTCSPYVRYPGYRPPSGALGEYNAKFMANQFVLRGGSCASPRSHLRATYRNFFPPDARWQFTGFRLSREMVE